MSKKHRLKGLRLDELSLVDRPANSAAKVAIWKRKDDPMTEKAMHGDKKEMDKMTDAEKRRMRELMDKGGMSEKDAMAQTMREMRKSDDAEASEAEAEDTPDNAAGSPGTTPSEGDEGMTPDELEKRLGELESQVNSLTKQAEDHGLKVEKADDGSMKLTKAASEEYVEFDGEKIAKSALPEPVLKRLEAQNERLEKMEREREAEDLRKRADSEVPNLKGTADERGALLKAVDGIQDQTTREAVLSTLKAADAATKTAFLEVGKTAMGETDANDPSEKLEKMAQDYAKEHGVNLVDARAAVAKSKEGREIRKQIDAERRAN